jgi:EmrB/QacA subfamily drug resistance transporter
MSVSASSTSAPLRHETNRRMVVVAILVTNFLAAMEATVVSTAMPTVISALGGIERFSWVFSAYILTSTVVLPIWGKLADLYGRRLFLQLALGTFLLGSALAGVAADLDQLIAARALQGLGAGGLLPLGMTILGDLYTPTQRARMQARFSSVWGVASVVGPLLGGYLTDRLSWRWVFFVNLPVGLVAAALIRLYLREQPRPGARRIDVAGAATLALSASLLLVGLNEAGTVGLAAPEAWGLLLAASAVFAVFVACERRAVDPIVPPSLVRARDIRWPLVCSSLAGMSLFGAISFIPIYIQGSTGSTATQAGFALTPLLLCWVLASILTGRLVAFVSVRTLAISGFGLVFVGFVVLLSFDSDTARGWLYADMAVLGGGMGLAMLCLLLAIQTVAPRRDLGVATSLMVFCRSLGGAIGVALLGAVLTATLQRRLGALGIDAEVVNHLLALEAPRDAAAPALAPEVRGAFESSLGSAFAAAAAIALLTVLAATRLSRHNLSELERRHVAPEAGA